MHPTDKGFNTCVYDRFVSRYLVLKDIYMCPYVAAVTKFRLAFLKDNNRPQQLLILTMLAYYAALHLEFTLIGLH